KTGTRRQIAVVMNLEPLLRLKAVEHSADGRMCDLADLLHVLDDRVDDAEAVIEKRRQLPHADVAVLVDRRRQDGAAVLAEPVGIVGASAKERHPKRRAADDHL